MGSTPLCLVCGCLLRSWVLTAERGKRGRRSLQGNRRLFVTLRYVIHVLRTSTRVAKVRDALNA